MRALTRTLAGRLALWFALASALVLGATGAYLYRSLEQQLVERDDEDLIVKIEQLRHRLRGIPGGVEGVSAREADLLSNVFGHADLFLQVRDSGGSIVAASHPGMNLPAPPMILAASQPPDGTWVRKWNGGRVLAAWAAVGSPPRTQVLVILAREGTQRAALLEAYKADLTRGVVAGALAMALLGYAVARSALRSVRAVARTAAGITADRLGNRLRLSDAPAELAELIHAFNAMLRRLDDSFRRLAQFSSDIAHDLRTPIANLVSGTEVMLSRRRSTEDYEALLGSHLEEYQRINRMIDGMLFLARADNALLAVHRETFDAGQELIRIAEYFSGPAEEAGVSIDVSAKGCVHADPGLFRRAVVNLVTNALRFTPRGQRVKLRAFERRDGGSIVEVINPGSPIPPCDVPHIFERFYRGDGARSDSQSGSGLGLAIVRSIMALHGGQAAAESLPGSGTVLRLSFPE